MLRRRRLRRPADVSGEHVASVNSTIRYAIATESVRAMAFSGTAEYSRNVRAGVSDHSSDRADQPHGHPHADRPGFPRADCEQPEHADDATTTAPTMPAACTLESPNRTSVIAHPRGTGQRCVPAAPSRSQRRSAARMSAFGWGGGMAMHAYRQGTRCRDGRSLRASAGRHRSRRDLPVVLVSSSSFRRQRVGEFARAFRSRSCLAEHRLRRDRALDEAEHADRDAQRSRRSAASVDPLPAKWSINQPMRAPAAASLDIMNASPAMRQPSASFRIRIPAFDATLGGVKAIAGAVIARVKAGESSPDFVKNSQSRNTIVISRRSQVNFSRSLSRLRPRLERSYLGVTDPHGASLDRSAKWSASLIMPSSFCFTFRTLSACPFPTPTSSTSRPSS